MVMTNHNFTVTIPAASPIFWNQLSDTDKELIQTLMIEAQNLGRENTEKLVDGFLDIIRTHCEIIELSNEELMAFQDQAKTVWPMIEEQMGTEAYNKLLDFMAARQEG